MIGRVFACCDAECGAASSLDHWAWLDNTTALMGIFRHVQLDEAFKWSCVSCIFHCTKYFIKAVICTRLFYYWRHFAKCPRGYITSGFKVSFFHQPFKARFSLRKIYIKVLIIVWNNIHKNIDNTVLLKILFKFVPSKNPKVNFSIARRLSVCPSSRPSQFTSKLKVIKMGKG